MLESVNIWRVSLLNEDWYEVFAKHEKEALEIVVDLHYDMDILDFIELYKPKIYRIPDNEIIIVNCEDRGQQSWTAKRWAAGETSGPFVSNTYAW